MLRTGLYANPHGRFVHDLILESCARVPHKTAIIDSSCDLSSSNRRITYSQYGELIEKLARGLVAAGLMPGEVIAIYLPNSWEFSAVYHAATLAGATPTLLNPSYREREVRHQLGNSGAAFLITDGPNIEGVNLAGLANLRRVYCTREQGSGSEPFSNLLKAASAVLPEPDLGSEKALGALPYSSG